MYKKLITHWSITWNLKILIPLKNTIPMIIQYFSFPHWFPRNSGIPGIWIFSKELPKFLEFIQTGFWISCTIYSSLGLRCVTIFTVALHRTFPHSFFCYLNASFHILWLLFIAYSYAAMHSTLTHAQHVQPYCSVYKDSWTSSFSS